jgi:hypothetical protein
MDAREYVLAQMGAQTHASFLSGSLHRMPTKSDTFIETLEGERKTPQQAAWWLENEAWEDNVLSTCGREGCCTHLALDPTTVPADAGDTAATEEALLGLVQRQSTTLADLYRRGRKKGLLAPQQDYHQG